MTNNVRKMVAVEDDASVVKVVATAFSLVVGISADRQITFQSGFEGDEPEADVHARIDRMLALADRSRSRYEIPDLEDELAKAHETVTNLQADLERIDAQHERAQAARQETLIELSRLCAADVEDTVKQTNVTILGIQQTKAKILEEGAEKYRKSGKLGSYVPRGADEANMARCDKGLESLANIRETEADRIKTEYERMKLELQAEIDKAEAEREQHKLNQTINLDRWNKAIVELVHKLARARSVAGV